MKALTITSKSVTREVLLGMARRVPGAWIGIRIAALLLLLEGWKSTKIAGLFGISRWSMVKWIHKVNKEGIGGIPDKPRSGRPCRLDEKVLKDLEEALEKSPVEFGLKRNRWDGIVQNDKGNTDGFINTLRTIRYRFKETLIDIWVDNARWHKGNKVNDFLCLHKELRINYIPKYHPELNKQEVLWRFMRYEETTDTYYESFEELKIAIFKRSQRWKPHKVRSLCHLN